LGQQAGAHFLEAFLLVWHDFFASLGLALVDGLDLPLAPTILTTG